ncbi:hypothetical protein K1719_018425 [Acacia pycnantha]|nr:hypothetical protein K1719_035100 [Acacia pycnantha]KAI9110559.1 hypothetical protein K1719_018425 [Acacia pycnantha]
MPLTGQNAISITTNGNVIIFIPFHLVHQILLHLDARTIFKCAFRCRDWNSFITCPDSISHRSRQTFESKSQLLLIDEVRDGRQQSFSLYRDNDQFGLIHTVESPPIFDGFKGIVVALPPHHHHSQTADFSNSYINKGYMPKKNRMHHSGPLVPPGANIDDMLREHERLMQEAFRTVKDKNNHNKYL